MKRGHLTRSFAEMALFLGSVLLSALFAAAEQESREPAVYPPPDYATFVPPPRGESYTDETFHTSIQRLSDATKIRDVAAGVGYVPNVTAEYSSMSPFNQENSRLLLQHGSYFALYDQAGQFLKNLPFEVSSSSEPRWARNEPNILYYHVGNQLKRLDVSKNSIKTLHVFSEYSRIDGAGESDICFDGNHLALAGDRRFIFVYDLKTGKKGPVLDAGRQTFDSLYITPDDHITVTWSSEGDHSGIELFDREMKFLRRVAPKGGHMDVTRDIDGEEALLWANAADPMPVCENGIVKIRLSDGAQTCLIRLDWSLAMHVSATDNSGWFFVETYAPRDPEAATDGWKAYTNEILQVKLDGSEIRRLAHHRSRPFDSYSYQPKVSASRDGTRIVFSSNYGLRSLVESAQADARGGKKASLDKLRAALRANSSSLQGYLNPRYSDVYSVKVDPRTGGTAISERQFTTKGEPRQPEN